MEHQTPLCPSRITTAAFVLICLAVDLCPHRGPPHFRYTGSDPAHEVCNIGRPLALFIFDTSNRLHVGPFAYLMVPFQLCLLAFAVAVVTAFRRHARTKQGVRHA